MIKTEHRISEKSGVHTTIYRNDRCQLRFTGFPDIPTPGHMEHITEFIYAPKATIHYSREDGWIMLLMMPQLHIAPTEWSRLRTATEDMLSFWAEVKGELQPPEAHPQP